MNIIIRPVITEKSMRLASGGWYAFAAYNYARKPSIAKAIHDMYNVNDLQVRTMSMHGKMRKAGKKMKLVNRPDWKKILVRLKTGQTIPIFDTAAQSVSKK